MINHNEINDMILFNLKLNPLLKSILNLVYLLKDRLMIKDLLFSLRKRLTNIMKEKEKISTFMEEKGKIIFKSLH